MFRDGIRAHFPRKETSQAEIEEARKLDEENKLSNEGKVNSSKYRKKSNISVGDIVVVRDCSRKSKFDPIFLPDPFAVISIDEIAKKVILEGIQCNKLVARHLDDVKEYHGTLDDVVDPSISESQAGLLSGDELTTQEYLMEDYDGDVLHDASALDNEVGTRTSSRTRSAPRRLIEEV